MEARASPRVTSAHPTQLIDPEGSFDRRSLDESLLSVGVADRGLDYALVAIMGPQSSGKSTLLNAVFGTQFLEMDALGGRKQTTRGVWISRSVKCDSRCTLVLDMEGSDGRERGEHDTYEKQTSLFAMAVADVLLINIWCHDIGREAGAGKPLLRTVLQVNFKLFNPSKTVLLFVIRDRSKTPQEKLEQVLLEDMEDLWDSINKPENHKEKSLQDYFDIKFVTLPNFEEKEDEFRAEATLLRRRFSDPNEPESLIPMHASVPIEALPLSAEKIWETIVENKDLDLPAHQVMIATVRCDQILTEQLDNLRCSEQWKKFLRDSNEALVEKFSQEAKPFLEDCLHAYDKDAQYFDESVRKGKREELIVRFSEMLVLALESQLSFLQEGLMSCAEKFVSDELSSGRDFTTASEECASTCMAAFRSFTDDCLSVCSTDALQGPIRHAEKTTHKSLEEMLATRKTKSIRAVLKEISSKITDLLSEPVLALLEEPSPSLWKSLWRMVSDANEEGCALLESGLKGFALSAEEQKAYAEDLQSVAYELVEGRVKEAAQHAVPRIRNAFNTVFLKDSKGLPRTWARNEDIPTIAKKAYLHAADTLALLSVNRLRNKDNEEDEAKDAAEEAQKSIRMLAASSSGSSEAAAELLSRRTWPHALLTPAECVRAWSRFEADAQLAVSQAMATQEAHARAARASLPPWWALLAIAVLGMDEFMAVLRSPLLLLVVVTLVVVARVVYLRFGGFQHAIAAAAVALAGGGAGARVDGVVSGSRPKTE